MIDVKRDFESRVNEIELYFSFMQSIMLKGAKLVYPDDSIEIFTTDIKEIFKANSFLLLYNLSESCIKNGMEKIYSTLDYERVNYDDLKEGIRKEIIRFLKKNVKVDDFVSDVNNIAYDIVIKCFESEKLLSGNLDARKVRDLASKYGFSYVTTPLTLSGRFTHINSNNLLTVKTRRNDLAHGTYSFKECGREYTIQDLITIKNHVIAYLRQILNNIEKYIANKEYLLN